jgi:PAT family beta-lactamase induction signal transducer AmpG
MAVLLGLGFASGLPNALSKDTLASWMTDAKVDIRTIGAFSLVTLPYALKFLWAPLLDRYSLPFLGRRRGWLVVTQTLVFVAVAAMAAIDPSSSLAAMAAAALALAFMSATQDIVADGYRADVLGERELGAGNAVFVSGWRVGYLASSAGVLWLVGTSTTAWPAAYLLAAATMAIGLLATLAAPEPEAPPRPETFRESVVAPFREFLATGGGWLVLLFATVFKLPDVVVGPLTVPFMQQIGIAKQDIATVRQGLGIIVTIVGTLVGGGIVARFGVWRSLWVFGIAQAVSNLGFWALARTGPQLDVMTCVIAVENFCAGLTTAGFLSFLMSRCDRRFSATQFALLTGVMAFGASTIGAASGWVQAKLGWEGFFAASVVAGLPGLFMLPLVRRPSDDAVSADPERPAAA